MVSRGAGREHKRHWQIELVGRIVGLLAMFDSAVNLMDDPAKSIRTLNPVAVGMA
jgi:hypothetical protein